MIHSLILFVTTHARPLFTGASLLLLAGASAFAQTSVTTYHYDNLRTGWNSNEVVLTPSNVSGSNFGALKTVTLDDQVDAQPLVVPGVRIITGNPQGSVHDVVYVATEGNTVYGIDANNGTVLLSQNFGAPVVHPIGCYNNGPNVGITSTPVIDIASGTLYVIAYNQTTSGQAYYIHALALGTLKDKVAPQLITASHTLSDGSKYTFNATVQRQRPGLLLANGVVYAGFGSFCDLGANLSRGWLLGWQAGTLKPLAANQLIDTQASSPDSFFLSSIWMSGYGPAMDYAGNILFVTGNSDPSTYNGLTNIQESVIKLSPDLTTVLDLFTPMNEAELDYLDYDFSAGGVMLLPPQPGSVPHMAVAAGKDGIMYFMNEDHLGGYSTTTNNVLGTYQIGGCWCGQSYFLDPADGLARVVSSGGWVAQVWKLATSPSPSLSLVTSSPSIATGQDPGFFTSVSSNGTANPIIWALSRPAAHSATAAIYLYAFDPESGGGTMSQLVRVTAGAWPNITGNSNLVPVVANGKVYVASNKQLQIFGLK